jgi:hypothetical protein
MGGGYDTHEKPRLSTGGWGVQAWRDLKVGGNGKKSTLFRKSELYLKK